MSGGINNTTINNASTAVSVGVEPEAGERIDPATNNAVPVSKERAEYVAKAGPYDRYQAMQDLRDANQGKWVYRACRRVFDIVFSGAVITAGLIPGALICAAICLESPGSPIYSQKRICRTHRDGRMHEFTMYKFRSMYKDADERLKELQGCNEADGAMFKIKDDLRVTKVGRFLRRHSIDEFPQFINVFLGQIPLRILKTRPEFFEKSMGAFARPAKSSTNKEEVFSQVVSCFASGLPMRRISGLNCKRVGSMGGQFLAKPVFKAVCA